MNNGESNNNNSNGIPNGTSNGNNHNNNNTGGSNAKPNNANKPRRSRAAAGRNVPALVEQTDLAQLLQPTFMADGEPLLEANNVRNGRKRPHSVLEQECVGVGSSSNSSSSAINNNNDSFTSSGHEMEFVLPICTRPMQALNSASVGIDSQFLAGTSSVGFHEFSSPMCTRPMPEMNSSSVGTGSPILAGTSSVGFHEFASPMCTRPMPEMNSSSVGTGSQILAGTSSAGFHEFASPMGTRPMPEMNSSSVGSGSQILAGTSSVGLQDVPEHIRDAVCRVNARQLSKMVDVHPAYAADVPSIGANGLSNLMWLLLDWTEGMVMQRVVGIVAAAGPFQTQGNLQGFDVRLVLNGPDGQELALHAWGELAGRLSGLRVNDVAEFFRLKVRGQCKFPKGSFPYVLLFNGESRCQLLSRASSSSAITAISVGEGLVAPMVVEPIEWSGAVAEPLQGGQRSAESPAANVVVAAHVGNAQNGQEEAEEDDDEESADSDQNGTATTVS